MSDSLAGFSPLVSDNCTKLILGSMPGVESLNQQQYYAHPRNAFWPIMASICHFDLQDYSSNCLNLNQSCIALWDIIASCQRKGSLDSAIIGDSVVVNDFSWLFSQYKAITDIYCNGGKSHSLFKKHIIKPNLLPRHINVHQMPSTSPAYAAMKYSEKLSKWSKALQTN
jgi:hypoxanthine-DNA glycosylase